jgi:hypothetical protein
MLNHKVNAYGGFTSVAVVQLSHLYPGRSNAIDGYLVFEVPALLTPEKTYAEIAFKRKYRRNLETR